jgi:hydroxyacylglutathione hydrolase
LYFRQVLNGDLACASYVVADGEEAAVVDPRWEIDAYLALADEHGFHILHVLETHTHADHVSGRGRLVEATGARVWISGDADVAYEHTPLADGKAVDLGDVRLVAVATPGHRPEHTAFLVLDRTRADAPWMLLTGDSLFVGDVARPDLAVEPDDGARELFVSLRRLLCLDDFVEVWPGHIGGSLCGTAAMSQAPGSTIGFERRFNPLLSLADEDEFVRRLTSALEPQPPNFERIVALNRGPLLRHAAVLEPLAPSRAAELLREGAVLIDGRAPREFMASHVRGSLNVTMTNAGVGTRAAWVVDADTDVVALAASNELAHDLGRMLEAVGFRAVRGYASGGIAAWQAAVGELASVPSIDVPALAEQLRAGEVELLDVREDAEWRDGHVAGSAHVPYHELRDGLPRDVSRSGAPLAVACSAGNRSALAVALLERAGVEDIVHVADGGVELLAKHGVELVGA